jgi:pimeloyl-ACP methyl ester carboxylesterase
LERLSAERDVLAPTMLGHLGGPAISRKNPPSLRNILNHILSVLDEAGFDRPDVVGNSVGGILALELGRMNRARSVVAICPEGKQSRLHALSLFARGYLSHQAARRLSPLLRQALHVSRLRKILLRSASARGDRISVELSNHLLHAVSYCNVLKTLIANIDGLWNPVSEDVSDVTCPVYFMWGKQDTFVSEKEMDRYRADLPHAKYLAIDNCGHCPQLDRPELVADEIISFTDAVETASEGRQKDKGGRLKKA